MIFLVNSHRTSRGVTNQLTGAFFGSCAAAAALPRMPIFHRLFKTCQLQLFQGLTMYE